jgi:DNA polymerase III delta prime subunit
MERQDLIFRVFVSSTFIDLVAERNALQEDAFPELRKYCQERGARFQAIDLRWGVGQEAAVDQQTMNICLRELKRCQELSPRPNFIVLLGDRYGWRPLPAQMEAGEFEAILAKVPGTEKDDKTDKGRALRWYKRDDNAIPPEYCLLARTGEFTDAARWAGEEAEVRAILLKAVEQALPADDPRRRKWCDSATHQEIQHGAMEAENPQNHVFCYFRQINGLPEDSSAAKYREIRDGKVDTEAQDHLAGLKGELKALLPPKHVHKYAVAWQGGQPELDKVALKELCEAVKRNLIQVIDREVERFKKQPTLDREANAQREFAEERCRHFVGRDDILGRIDQYLESKDENNPLIIHGKSGCGKTALMAKAALNLAGRAAGSLQTAIFHFIGATPASCDLRSLLTSLCRQMGIESVPSDMNELVKAFRDRLSPPGQAESKAEGSVEPKDHQPVTIFLDALDQLNPTDNARMLYWLPRELAPGVKLVLSILQTDRPAEQTSPAGQAKPVPGEYDCYDLAGRIWPGRLVELGGLEEKLAPGLLKTWLDEAGRTLQPRQQEHILAKFSQCPLPLYLKLAFGEARRWKSWDDLPHRPGAAPGISGSVEGILEDLLCRLEEPRNHGRILVGRALGYIAAAKNGLTEDELIEILSADKDVMKWFVSQSPTEQAKVLADRIKSLPVVIWSRLFMDVEPYMARRRADGTIVMDFYHRQVGQAVRQRYLNGDARWQAHQHLAEYFHGMDYWAESLEAQRARAKRLPPTPRPANVRKVVELPYHRLEVAKLAGKDDPKSPYWDAVADLLMDWQFLEAKAEADPNFREQESAAPPPATTGEAKP